MDVRAVQGFILSSGFLNSLALVNVKERSPERSLCRRREDKTEGERT